MFFLAEMEVGPSTKIILGIVESSTEKLAVKKIADFLRQNDLDVKFIDGNMDVEGKATVNLLRIYPIKNTKEPIELAKRFLRGK